MARTNALTLEQQTARINEAKQIAAEFNGSAVAQHGFCHEYGQWNRKHEVVFEDTGIGVVTRQDDECVHIGVAVVTHSNTHSRRNRLAMELAFTSVADEKSVEAHIERATQLALQLIRLRQGGWAIKSPYSGGGFSVHSPVTDGHGKDILVAVPYRAKRYDYERRRHHGHKFVRPATVIAKLAELPDSPDGARINAISQAAKRSAVAAERAAEKAERQRRLAEKTEAARAKIAESAREHLVCDRVINASPELSAADTVAVIERVQERIGERPSAAMLSVIAEELGAQRKDA